MPLVTNICKMFVYIPSDRRWVESQHRDRDNFAERYGSGNVHPRSDRGPGASPESPNSRQNGPEQGPDHRPSGPSEHKVWSEEICP